MTERIKCDKSLRAESYRYLYKPNEPCLPRDVLECKYSTQEELLSKFIIFDSQELMYFVFDGWSSFDEFYRNTPAPQRTFHEVIFGFSRQKLKWDIDANKGELDELLVGNTAPTELTMENLIAALCEEDNKLSVKDQLLGIILRTIKDTFYLAYFMEIPDEDVIITESHTPTKYSFHIIINKTCVENYKDAAEFTSRFLLYLPEEYHKTIDMHVNKSVQNFRIAGCSKKTGGMQKKIITDHCIRDSLISQCEDCKVLPALTVDVEEPMDKLTLVDDEDASRVLEAAKVFTDHQYRERVGNLFIFDRLRGGNCDICTEARGLVVSHTQDHTMLLLVKNTPTGIIVWRSCRKDKSKTKKLLFSDPGATMDVHTDTNTCGVPISTVETVKIWMNKTLSRAIDNKTPLPPSLFDKLPVESRNVYDEPTLRNFELVPTLAVKANMKMGKTKKLIEHMDKYFKSVAREHTIRFISFRQTFSSNIKEKFADFTLYSDVKGLLRQKRLIVQVESLHRVSVSYPDEAPDLLILDECESIFDQFNSGLLRKFGSAFAVFQWMLRNSKHVILMDAHLSDRTFRMLKLMRPGDIFYHCNTHKNAIGDKYYFTTDKLHWLGVLYSSIEGDEKISVPMNSLTEAKTLIRCLQKRFPAKQFKIYSSETQMSEKKLHFNNVNLYWVRYDGLLYTPTVSAGVSFEQAHFDRIFGYFTDMSCGIETCIQMIGRIRNVISKTYFICMVATSNNLPVEIEDIKRHIKTKRENLYKTLGDSPLQFTYGANGEIEFYNNDYFYLWLENTRIRNLSVNSFIKRFIQFIRPTGANIEYLSADIYKKQTGDYPMIDGELNPDLETIRRNHSDVKSEIKAEDIEKITAAKEIDEDEASEISTIMSSQQDLGDDQKHAFNKWRLRQDYHYEGEITEQFVKNFYDRKIRFIFKNLSRVWCGGKVGESIDDILKRIQKEELAHYSHVMERDEKYQLNDVSRRYVFERHRIALGFLQVCGFNNVVDPKKLSATTLHGNLRENENTIFNNSTVICTEFELRKPNLQDFMKVRNDRDQYICELLKYINKVLGVMYGCSIINRVNEPDIYYLKHNKLFICEGGVVTLNIPAKK